MIIGDDLDSTKIVLLFGIKFKKLFEMLDVCNCQLDFLQFLEKLS